MSKTNITIPYDEEKLSALDFALRKENTTAQQKIEKAVDGEFGSLTVLRMENTGEVSGVFDIDFDKKEISAVNIMDGWQTFATHDVSTAAYHAARKCDMADDERWRIFLDFLEDKAITSAGHLSSRNISFDEEITEMDERLNFYIRSDFDVDAAFGTHICTSENDDWMNV